MGHAGPRLVADAVQLLLMGVLRRQGQRHSGSAWHSKKPNRATTTAALKVADMHGALKSMSRGPSPFACMLPPRFEDLRASHLNLIEPNVVRSGWTCLCSWLVRGKLVC